MHTNDSNIRSTMTADQWWPKEWEMIRGAKRHKELSEMICALSWLWWQFHIWKQVSKLNLYSLVLLAETSQAVQWLRLFPLQGVWVWSLVKKQWVHIPCRVAKKERKNFTNLKIRTNKIIIINKLKITAIINVLRDTFLEVQWVRLPTQEAWVPTMVRKLRFHMPCSMTRKSK